MKRFIILISCILIVGAAGALSSAATLPNITTWYATLNKPSFNPPNSIFGPVWLILYLLMAIALFIYIIRNTLRSKLTGYINFFIQLILNAMWSVIFFSYHQTYTSFYIILFLWVFIVLTMIDFSRISKPATALLVPYLLWVSFASVLNFAIWQMN